MAEKDLSRLLMSRMRRFGHFARIENMVEVGTPDVTYCVQGCEGFIENKWRLTWPHDAHDVVTLPHFTPQQRIWIQQRRAAGGTIHVFLEIERPVQTYFLLPGDWARVYLGKTATRADIEAAAMVTGVRQFPALALRDALTAGKSAT
jgi:hypothetical protein